MSGWTALAQCSTEPRRDNQSRIIWKELTQLSVSNAEQLRRDNVLLMASRFDHVHQIRTLVVRVKPGQNWKHKQARSLLDKKYENPYQSPPAAWPNNTPRLRLV
jgi:hypothetical protein